MQLSELLELTNALRYLGKRHPEWGAVYRRYLKCMGLIFMIGIIRFFFDLIVIALLTIIAYVVFSSLKVQHRYLAVIPARSHDISDVEEPFRERFGLV